MYVLIYVCKSVQQWWKTVQRPGTQYNLPDFTTMVKGFQRIDNNVSPEFIEVQRICSHYVRTGSQSFTLVSASESVSWHPTRQCQLFLFVHCLCFSVVSYLMCTITDYNNTVKYIYINKQVLSVQKSLTDVLGCGFRAQPYA